MKKVKAKTKPSRKQMLLAEAKDAEMRATYHDYYGRKTPEYYVEMRLAARLRELAG